MKISIIPFFLALLVSCASGSTLRTARTLEKDQLEVSGGATINQYGVVTPVVIAAFGMTDHVEVEGRWEDEYFAVTPRVQLFESGFYPVDGLAFFELGYSDFGGLQFGPGIIIGKRWRCFEPYLSYRFRHISDIAKLRSEATGWEKELVGNGNYHYIKLGNRLYLSDLFTKTKCHSTKFFIGAEIGPNISNGGSFLESAINFGFDY